jgi:hypothetical protein
VKVVLALMSIDPDLARLSVVAELAEGGTRTPWRPSPTTGCGRWWAPTSSPA